MKNIEIRTQDKATKKTTYRINLSNVIVFLRHDEDKIIVRDDEQVMVEVYHNGELIFSDSKIEFYNKLKNNV
ncbi:MAG TPA: hypothetical protein PLJ18_11560 [Niabella sp.]|nr:hypothetical protein [Bacteroidia bacterium]HOZ91460.1 hypothetical protein [Bacteroidia bacterium]HRB52081.1 hypothetical protein [Bacteroidia bacterium]HRC03083.1 hypothetical protein [Niabella sp.]